MKEKQDKAVKKFLTHMNKMVDYWNKEDSCKDKADAMLFTLLVTLDGGDSEFPSGFKLIDKETGEDISIGYLHEIKNDFKKE